MKEERICQYEWGLSVKDQTHTWGGKHTFARNNTLKASSQKLVIFLILIADGRETANELFTEN